MVGIPAAVLPFVMGADDRPYALQRLHCATQVVSYDRMLSHQRELIGVEAPGLQ
jgi:hypothetical protein